MQNARGTHVILVDDEPKVCGAVRKTLERTGLRVLCFHSAEDCLAHLADIRCDLLITDLKLPGKDGVELLREARRQLPWLPVLVVTGYGDVPTAVRALKSGAGDFLEKPFDRETLLTTVQSLLEQGAAQAALYNLSLTHAEIKVLRLMLEGKNSREIAAALNRSPRTVEVHRGHMMQKMQANNTVMLLRRAADLGLFSDARPGLAEGAARRPRHDGSRRASSWEPEG